MGRKAQREMFTGQMNRTWSLLRSGTVSEGDAPGKLSRSVMGQVHVEWCQSSRKNLGGEGIGDGLGYILKKGTGKKKKIVYDYIR